MILAATLVGMMLGLSVLTPPGESRHLFNGKDVSGWAHVGKGRVYVEGGLMKTEGGMGLLWYTREKFGDCTIRVVYRTTDLSRVL